MISNTVSGTGRCCAAGVSPRVIACEVNEIAVAGELEVHLLAVAPRYRRAGIGEALGFHREPARDWTRADGRGFLAFSLDLMETARH